MTIGLENDWAASDWIWNGLRLLVEGKGLGIGGQDRVGSGARERRENSVTLRG